MDDKEVEMYAGRVILNIGLDEYKTDMEEAFLAGRGSADSFETFYKTWGDSNNAKS